MRKVHMVLTSTKMFFQGGEKTTNNQGGGERKVRNDPHKEQWDSLGD